jgi:hypothetical protein
VSQRDVSQRVWFSPLDIDLAVVNFAPTFPRRISGFAQFDGRLYVVCADGQRYEVKKEYLEPRMSFAEWARKVGH